MNVSDSEEERGGLTFPRRLAIKYRDFGLFLLDDPNGVRIRALAHKHNNDANEINIQIIEEWVAGKGKHPVTWKTLTEVLHDIVTKHTR